MTAVLELTFTIPDALDNVATGAVSRWLPEKMRSCAVAARTIEEVEPVARSSPPPEIVSPEPLGLEMPS